MEERDYQKVDLKPAEVKRIVDAAGGVAAVLNTRHAIAKENGWKDSPPSRAMFATAVAETANLLRRPVLIAGDAFVVGKDEDAIRSALAG